MNFTPQYSVVAPVYNSEKTLEELCSRIDSTFSKLGVTYQIVLVNDHSTDGSWNVIKQLKQKYGPLLVAVHLRRNFGQHKALLCGFHFAKGEYIITIDDDLQFFPEDIELLINKAKETHADLVYGTYLNGRQHSAVRRWGSSFVSYVFEKFGNTTGQGSSFKLISSEIIEKIKHYNHSFTFLDEIFSWHTTHIAYVQVRHNARREGRSGYNIFKLVFLTMNLIFGYTTIPLRFMTWFGFTSFMVCLAFVFYFIYLKFTVGARLGFTAAMVTIYMSTGLILFSLGIIGEYLNRVIALQHRKPPYQIEEVLK
ncbi:MAG TPA: glycosyltransferase family 2 protein [Chitinophagales bacterium]|nr:glycosyltransferase family 2 protein [Chitinophagales bacterium]